MKLTSARIQNFKALKDVTLELSNFNVLVGPNGSGKSSVLQALHWMIQSARNPAVQANSKHTDGSTLSVAEASYMPSPDYKDAGNEGQFGNFQKAQRMDVTLWGEQAVLKTEAKMWMKAARNEGLSVHFPSGNQITTEIRSQDREFSTYIPGLAGIPLSEERRAQSIVLRQAAAGDANTVLRNFLLLLDQEQGGDPDGPMSELKRRVAAGLRATDFKITFDDEKDYKISAQFKTEEMTDWRPLELAGIGFYRQSRSLPTSCISDQDYF